MMEAMIRIEKQPKRTAHSLVPHKRLQHVHGKPYGLPRSGMRMDLTDEGLVDLKILPAGQAYVYGELLHCRSNSL